MAHIGLYRDNGKENGNYYRTVGFLCSLVLSPKP